MTGIERLREVVRELGEFSFCYDLYETLGNIADQIERELREERDRWESDLYEAQVEWNRVMGVCLEMERHCLYNEDMADRDVARWARELRHAMKSDASDECGAQKPSWHDPADAADVTSDATKVTRDPAEDVSVSAYDLLPQDEREAIAWVREHGGLENLKANLAALELFAEGIEIDTGRVFYDESMGERCAALRNEVKSRLMPEGMEWLLEVWPKWSNGEYCRFSDWWTADKYGDYEPRQLRRLVFYTPEQLREWEQDEGDNFGYEWDFMRPSDTTYRPDKAEPPAPKVLDADGAEIRVGDTVGTWTARAHS